MGLKQKKENLLNNRVHKILPFSVSENYQMLWRRFYRRGEASFIERRRLSFLRNSNGFIIPVEIIVKFYNEKQYSDCFIGMVRRLQCVFPFPGRTDFDPEIPVKNLLFLITDESGTIVDASSRIKPLVGISSISQRLNQISL